ncbi:hypothetical protein [Candidatus Amarobacter glycogenicus]|uniref:phosphotriesterase family protein n=1 Tax=Candidatus Amarobacter glycogenicus TaxID=3140699 RepID=UPI0031CC95F6
MAITICGSNRRRNGSGRAGAERRISHSPGVDGLHRAAGGGAMVDCQPGGCGRNGRILANLSRATGVHVIACTGFHLRRYYPPHAMLWQLSAEAAADLFVEELTGALRETKNDSKPVRAGFLKIAGESSFEQTPGHLLEAAAAACRATGCVIEMHTERGTAVEEFLQFFVDQKVDPRRLVFCHVDKRPDFGFHEALAKTGAMLEYDTFFRPKYKPGNQCVAVVGKDAGCWSWQPNRPGNEHGGQQYVGCLRRAAD